MQTAFPQLTPEQQQAIAASGGLPVQVQDPVTNKMYVLLEQAKDSALDDEYIREALSKGMAAIERGELSEWNAERVKQEGHRRLAARKAQD
jgi:hypothetical protein